MYTQLSGVRSFANLCMNMQVNVMKDVQRIQYTLNGTVVELLSSFLTIFCLNISLNI